ncbi:hypothetical protein HMPREF9069_01110 [Atopobium sp. oral taxon 810 str. F0209]|nr:hypothetical protein HMPREF9069_01110 [Atopobium sp. oral taxon 810 str. F0209]
MLGKADFQADFARKPQGYRCPRVASVRNAQRVLAAAYALGGDARRAMPSCAA